MKGGKRINGESVSGTQEQPLLSILTVVYNGAEHLQRTIDSVKKQAYPHIEYIIVDGASTDGTMDIVRRNEDHIDSWISEPDKGIYDAMNKGISECRGEFIGMINADDWYVDGAAELVMSKAVNMPEVNIFHGDIFIQYDNGHSKIKKAKRSAFLLKYWEMVLNHPSFFVRRSYYDDHLYDTSLRVSADHQWTLRAHLEDPTQFHYLGVPLANFNAGGASMTIPLKNVLKEGRNVCSSLKLGPFDTFMSLAVKTVLYIPQYLKLQFNQYLSPILHGNGK